MKICYPNRLHRFLQSLNPQSPPHATLAYRLYPDGREELVRGDLDVYAPCALGGALDDDTVAVLSAKVVCGAANNQLAHEGIEKQLEDRGILYAPDYMVNAGGLIQVADELEGFSFDRAKARAEKIFDTTQRVFALAAADGVPPAVAADRLAADELLVSAHPHVGGIGIGIGRAVGMDVDHLTTQSLSLPLVDATRCASGVPESLSGAFSTSLDEEMALYALAHVCRRMLALLYVVVLLTGWRGSP